MNEFTKAGLLGELKEIEKMVNSPEYQFGTPSIDLVKKRIKVIRTKLESWN